jgi:hypothetical protein
MIFYIRLFYRFFCFVLNSHFYNYYLIIMRSWCSPCRHPRLRPTRRAVRHRSDGRAGRGPRPRLLQRGEHPGVHTAAEGRLLLAVSQVDMVQGRDEWRHAEAGAHRGRLRQGCAKVRGSTGGRWVLPPQVAVVLCAEGRRSRSPHENFGIIS